MVAGDLWDNPEQSNAEQSNADSLSVHFFPSPASSLLLLHSLALSPFSSLYFFPLLFFYHPIMFFILFYLLDIIHPFSFVRKLFFHFLSSPSSLFFLSPYSQYFFSYTYIHMIYYMVIKYRMVYFIL